MKKRQIRKILKIILIVLCIIFLFVSITNSIMASDFVHILKCEMPDCIMCVLIHNAIDFIKIFNFVIIYVAMLKAIIPLICSVAKKIQHYKKESLVELKIVMNN